MTQEKDLYLFIRLGEKEEKQDNIIGRNYIGFSPDMTSEEIYNSARGYWWLDTDKFQRLIRIFVIHDDTVVMEITPNLKTGLMEVTQEQSEENNIQKGKKYFEGTYEDTPELPNDVGQPCSFIWQQNNIKYCTEYEYINEGILGVPQHDIF